MKFYLIFLGIFPNLFLVGEGCGLPRPLTSRRKFGDEMRFRGSTLSVQFAILQLGSTLLPLNGRVGPIPDVTDPVRLRAKALT